VIRFLDPRSDLVFERIFGEHPEIVRSFLKAVLPLEKGGEIELPLESAFSREELAAHERFWDSVRSERTLSWQKAGRRASELAWRWG